MSPASSPRTPLHRRFAPLIPIGLLLYLVTWADVALGGPASRLDGPAVEPVFDDLSGDTRTFSERFLSMPGDHAVVWSLTAVGALLCVAWGRRLNAVLIVVPSLLTLGFVKLMKWYVGRPRPDDSGLLDAFPSGHAAYTTVVWGLVLFMVLDAFMHRAGRPDAPVPARAPHVAVATWIGVSVLVGVARILGGVHWPTDIVASWGLGVAVVLGTLALHERLTAPVARPTAF